jgi:endonuclease/exonuclease/phosphatase family metal-dependent hydrolase
MSVFNRKHRLREIRDAIRSVEPDLVFLQEVIGANQKHSRRFEDWPDASQFEFLAESLWHHAYGRNAVYEAGHHGNAILSKYPILASQNLDVSGHRFESRGILHVSIDAPKPWGVVHGLCVHLGLTKKNRRGQVGKLLAFARNAVPEDAPLIVAGDFNDWSVGATQRLTGELDAVEVFQELYGKHANTFPARLPLFKLDRIYCRGTEIEYAAVLIGKPWNKLSDHAALYAELVPA